MRCWIMEHVVGKVKKYEREYSRKLKSGRSKTYKTEQYVITISKDDNIFEDGEQVVILSEKFKNSLINFDKDKTTFESDIIQLRSTNQKLSTTIEDQKSIIEDQENQITDFKAKNQALNDLNKELELFREYKDKYEHIDKEYKEALKKSEENASNLATAMGIIGLQREAITSFKERGFIGRLLNKLPESYLKLKDSEKDIEDL